MIRSVLRTLDLLVTPFIFTSATARDSSDMFVPLEPLVLMCSMSDSLMTPQPQQRCIAVHIANMYLLAQAHCVAQLQGGLEALTVTEFGVISVPRSPPSGGDGDEDVGPPDDFVPWTEVVSIVSITYHPDFVHSSDTGEVEHEESIASDFAFFELEYQPSDRLPAFLITTTFASFRDVVENPN